MRRASLSSVLVLLSAALVNAQQPDRRLLALREWLAHNQAVRHDFKYTVHRVLSVASPQGNYTNVNGLTYETHWLGSRDCFSNIVWDDPGGRQLRLDADGCVPEKLQDSLGMARELERIAKRRAIPIVEPFAGVGNSVLTVLGPSESYYRLLLADFEGTPEPHASLAGLFAKAGQKVSDAISYVRESFNIETLTDDGVTSSENNSSVILLLQLPTYKVLFTGDAGIPALTQAVAFASARGLDLSQLDVWQVPHHGSKRNVGPTILNRIKAKQGLISVAAGGAPKHPSKQVTNALIRRGTAVFVTQGVSFRHGHQAPARGGWDRSATQVPFYEQVEA